jgi:FMN phosphatase YigB (HAD superfamily)
MPRCVGGASVKIETVLFDVGLTLIQPDTERLEMVFARHLGASLGDLGSQLLGTLLLSLEADDEPFPVGKSGFDKVCRRWTSYNDFPGFPAQGLLREILDKDLLFAKLDPDAARVLQELVHRGYKLVAVSNNDGRLEDELLFHGVARWFTAMIDSSVFGISKPDVRIFSIAASAAGGNLQRSVMVGDGLHNDYLAALEAGVRRCVLYDRLSLLAHLPVLRISSLPALIGVLEELA